MKKWTLLTGALALSLSQTALSAGALASSESALYPPHSHCTSDRRLYRMSKLERVGHRGHATRAKAARCWVWRRSILHWRPTLGVYVPFYAEKEPAH